MQKDEMLGPNHSSVVDCTPWGLSGSGCRSDHQVLSSCHGVDTPKEHCQVQVFLSFHAERSAQLRQETTVFSLKSAHKKPKQKTHPGISKVDRNATFTPWGVCRD